MDIKMKPIFVQVDWDGNIVWKFDRLEYIQDPGYELQGGWLRAHHDYQRAGNPVGYYVPGLEPKTHEWKYDDFST